MNTRSSLAAAVSLVFLLGSGAQAQDKPPPGQGGQPGGGPPGMGQGQGENMRPKEQADPALPWNPFAKAKKGDWLTFVDEQKSERGSPKVRYHIWTVENVVDDKVTVKSVLKIKGLPDQTKTTTFSNASEPTLNKFLSGLHFLLEVPGMKFGNMTVDNAKQKINGKDVACKKVTAVASNPLGASWKVVLFFSDKLKGPAVAHLDHSVEDGGKVEMTIKGDAQGTGDEKKTDWGKTAKDVDDTIKKPDEPKPDDKKTDPPADPPKDNK